MASIGYVRAILNQLEATLKKALEPAFEHAMTDNILGTATKAANFRWVKVSSTTHADANTEFSIAHGLGSVPTWLIPALPLDSPGAKLLDLEVSRAADATRIYLKSPSTGATFTCFLEY